MQRPSLNRPEVAKISQRTGPEFIGWRDFGTYTLAIRHLQYREGERGKPCFLAHAVIIDSTNAAWAVGRETALYFPTGRLGDAADRDDANLVNFIRCVAKIERSAEADNDAELDKLIALGKMEHDKLQVRFIRGESAPQKKELKDSAGLVVHSEMVTYTRDSFEIVA